ncbi:hypothetical protein GOV04_05610 [Candidatus Woesearchaeota archaeon]|nr:hypothetical protein [Candidatus Woesearchaeota archaeon]
MDIKIKKINKDGIVRVHTSGKIQEVIINEDLFNPSDEKIILAFRGKDSSGLVELSTEEFEKLYKTIKTRLHLIKSYKIIK